MAAVQISLTKTGMVSVITVRMPGREKETPTVVEWVVSNSKDKAREIVVDVEVDVETNTGMVMGTKMLLLPNHRNPTTRSNRNPFNKEAKIFLIFGSILASFLFSQCTTE